RGSRSPAEAPKRLHAARRALQCRSPAPRIPPMSPAPPTPPANVELVQELSPADAELVRRLSAAYRQMAEQIGKVIVGQHEVVEQLLMALFSRGHCLLVGVPGLAKTLLVSTVSQILHLSFKRV